MVKRLNSGGDAFGDVALIVAGAAFLAGVLGLSMAGAVVLWVTL